jgi:beta-glucanase (GH16 family)
VDAAAVSTGPQRIHAAVPSGTPWNTPIPGPTTATTSSTPTAGATTPPAYAGWRTDWVDNLSVPIAQTKWGRYGWNNEAPGDGAMGVWSPANTFTSNGVMTLRTQYANGVWTSAGVSSGDLFSASGGRWEFRAKFPVSKGIQYAFLLYPADGTWPPEIDIAEGRVNGPQVMGAYHYDADNKQNLVFFDNPDMSGWHTYGVIVGATTITYTFDGRPWAVVTNPSVTTKKLWIGFQCSPMDPKGSAKRYETIDNGVPGPLTPAISDIQIDWVAHYVTA